MGGLAFASTLYTPRMPAAVYQAIRIKCRKILNDAFICVASPIDGPGKKDYGDVDFVVFGYQRPILPSSRSCSQTPDKAAISKNILNQAAKLLGATHIKMEISTSITMAIPWPKELTHLAPPMSAERVEGKQVVPTPAAEPYTQVDIHLCESLQQMQWNMFRHAHGEFWTIMGTILKPLGLVVDGHGLHIRIPEMEVSSPKLARVLLTKDIYETLSFLGLRHDGDVWFQPFESSDALFHYITSCRLFWLAESVAAKGEDEAEKKQEAGGVETKQTSSERKRSRIRPLVRDWYDIVLPRLEALRSSAHPGEKKDFPPTSPPYTREQLRHEALDLLFPHAKPEYERKLSAFLRDQEDHYIFPTLIRDLVPLEYLLVEKGDGGGGGGDDKSEKQAEQNRNVVVGALKKIVIKGQAENYGIELPYPMREDDEGKGAQSGTLIEENVRRFVSEWWPVVLDRALNVNNQKYRDSQERKKRKLLEREEEEKKEQQQQEEGQGQEASR